ncbi:SixA phosphatase family protein [Arthrobacter sp. 35W]|uniref:SixA phosphatase family protein n=1 Tax=Arthrobacter sp. 35W TaxID=1132441 RepID=UPI00047AB078|nr:histidine phosphatase family protein [Arthrobacter sp. 35W]
MSEHHVKRLILMRHAKAAYPLGVGDHDRPLAQRGHNEAPLAGKWLLENGIVPDFILCSSALRTRQTCTWVCQQLGDKAPTPKLEERLYATSATTMLSVINHVPDTVRTLMVISHLPGIQDLALRLASRDSDESAYMGLASNYPTSAFSVFEHTKDWAELDGQDARAVHFHIPR